MMPQLFSVFSDIVMNERLLLVEARSNDFNVFNAECEFRHGFTVFFFYGSVVICFNAFLLLMVISEQKFQAVEFS